MQIARALAWIGGPHLLEAAVVLAFVMFSLQPGAVGDVMRACTLLLLVRLPLGTYRLSQLNTAGRVMLACFLVLLAANFAAPGAAVHARSLSYFLAFPGMALAVHAIAVDRRQGRGGFPGGLFVVVVAAAVAANALAVLMLKQGPTAGVYSNPHHLGMFASLTLPVLFGAAAIHRRWPARLALAAAALVDLLLLFASNSRVSWLAFAMGAGFAVLYFLRGRQRLAAAGAMAAATLSAAVVFGLPRLVARLQFFLAHLNREARWSLWADTWKLMQDSTPVQWLIGHGIGSFRYYIPEVATVRPSGSTGHFSFPHNGLFQILFENGLVGCVVVFGGLLWLALLLMRGHRALRSETSRLMAAVVFALLLITFGHFMLTKSYYSKYIQYVLSVVVGMALGLLDDVAAHKEGHG